MTTCRNDIDYYYHGRRFNTLQTHAGLHNSTFVCYYLCKQLETIFGPKLWLWIYLVWDFHKIFYKCDRMKCSYILFDHRNKHDRINVVILNLPCKYSFRGTIILGQTVNAAISIFINKFFFFFLKHRTQRADGMFT